MVLLPTQQHRTEPQSLCCRYLAVDEARSCFTSGDPAFVPMHNPDTDVSTAFRQQVCLRQAHLHAQGL